MPWPLFELSQTRSSDPLDRFLDYVSQKNLALYPVQEEAILELYSGKNVILNTPTGSGKSLVATALHFHSLTGARRSIYTSPIKALANEKFLSLCREFGPERVGMVTGDATVNSEAPIICCTAEILSNLALRMGEDTPFSDIIMDEFHYYSDRDRGIAWQIPLLVLSQSRFLLMSATLGDTAFFERSLTELNGAPTALIQSGERPVPLEFEYSETPLHLKIARLIEAGKASIYVVCFSQRECAEQAQNLLSTDFCTKEEKLRISEALEGTSFNSPYGKDVQRLLKHGIGLHHAGLLPKYRMLVEKLAQKGLLKIICGTDTLGVGINVPIRTVLFTQLCKFDGTKTALLSIRDFKQISGRAGRKGFDERGTVVIQAPEHVIENLVLEQKASADPRKAKKIVKRKPPEKGYVPWSKETLLKLIEGQPETLTSRFNISHGLLLNVLSREGTRDCRNLRTLIKKSHETPAQKKKHGKLAFELFRSLLDRKIIELGPLRINIDLQQDFSLNQSLSLFLIDTLKQLDFTNANYSLDLLTLVESILEDPDLILRRQVDRLKTLKMEEMRAAGMEYDERIEELEKIEHPKPNRDFIYDRFNTFSTTHPWVGQENIRPKSVAREMYETFQSFHDYIREYDLHRVEGLLLRYLSDCYKVLVQTVPETARTDEVESMIEYFGEVLRGIDSSLVDEWERMRNPELALAKQEALRQKEAQAQALQAQKELEEKRKKARAIAARNEVFRTIRLLANGDFATAALAFSCSTVELETKMKEYFEDHQRILLDQNARSLKFSKVLEESPALLRVEQILTDADGHNDWVIAVECEVQSTGKPQLKKLYLGAIEGMR